MKHEPSALTRDYSEVEKEWLDTNVRLAARLAVATPGLTSLGDTIFEDLAEGRGVSWWSCPNQRLRAILAGDYLIGAVWSSTTSLIEAALHRLEMQEATQAQEELFRQHILGGGSPLKHPPPRHPMDEIPAARWEMHEVGFVRAIGSALDGFAALVLGILAIPSALYRASWGEARKQLEYHVATGVDSMVAEACAGILEVVRDSAPSGWLDWVLEQRNMLVHRARIMNWAQGRVPGGGRLALPGIPAQHLRLFHHLPRRPDLSFVEAMEEAGSLETYCLQEDADTTTAGLMEATRRTLDLACGLLVDHWSARRADPARHAQPVSSQWPARKRPALNFAGCDPGSLRTDVDSLMANPLIGRRLAAAGLFDHQRDPSAF